MLHRSQRNFAHVTTVLLSWRVQNFVVIDWAYFKLERSQFWSNFEFDRNSVSGTGARSMTFWVLVAIVFSLLGLLENISLMYNLYSPTRCKTSQSSRTCCCVSTGMPHALRVSLLVSEVVFHWHHCCLQSIAYVKVYLKLGEVFVCKITKPKDADISYYYKELDAVTRVRCMYCYNHYNETISNPSVYIFYHLCVFYWGYINLPTTGGPLEW